MKLKIFLALALVGILTGVAWADKSFTLTGKTTGFAAAVTNYVVIPASINGTPSVYNIQATVRGSDVTNQGPTVIAYWYTAGPPIDVTAANTVTNGVISVSQTNTLPPTTLLVLQHNPGDTYELLRVASIGTGTVTTDQGNYTAITIKDKVFALSVSASLDYYWPGYSMIQNAQSTSYTNPPVQFPWTITAPTPIWAGGVQGRPAAVVLIGTKTNTLNTVTGVGRKEAVQ